MISISNPPPVVPEDNARLTTKEKIIDGLVRTACAVAGISLIVIGVTAGLAIEGATIFGMMAACAAIIPTGGSLTPLALLAVLVILAVGSAISALTFTALPLLGGFLLVKAFTGTFPNFDPNCTGPTHHNRYDGYNWNPG